MKITYLTHTVLLACN